MGDAARVELTSIGTGSRVAGHWIDRPVRGSIRPRDALILRHVLAPRHAHVRADLRPRAVRYRRRTARAPAHADGRRESQLVARQCRPARRLRRAHRRARALGRALASGSRRPRALRRRHPQRVVQPRAPPGARALRDPPARRLPLDRLGRRLRRRLLDRVEAHRLRRHHRVSDVPHRRRSRSHTASDARARRDPAPASLQPIPRTACRRRARRSLGSRARVDRRCSPDDRRRREPHRVSAARVARRRPLADARGLRPVTHSSLVRPAARRLGLCRAHRARSAPAALGDAATAACAAHRRAHGHERRGGRGMRVLCLRDERGHRVESGVSRPHPAPRRGRAAQQRAARHGDPAARRARTGDRAGARRDVHDAAALGARGRESIAELAAPRERRGLVGGARAVARLRDCSRSVASSPSSRPPGSQQPLSRRRRTAATRARASGGSACSRAPSRRCSARSSRCFVGDPRRTPTVWSRGCGPLRPA